MNKKLKFIRIIFVIFMTLLFCRTAYLKINYGYEFEKQSKIQSLRNYDEDIPALRGNITDRNKTVLALSENVYNVIIEPITISSLEKEEKNKIFSSLNEILNIPIEELEKSISKNSDGSLIKNTYYLPIAKKISYEKGCQIEEKNLKGVWLENDSQRYYPYNNFASHVIGFMRNENMWGLEKYYNEELTGTDGRSFRQYTDDGAFVKSYDAKNGYSIVTTIDYNIQKAAEKGVFEAVNSFPCETASVIVTNPNTGEVLAMADSNEFNLNSPMTPTNISDTDFNSLSSSEQSEYINRMWTNFNVTNTFEPGSIFKPMVVAAALDENIITPDEKFYCEGYKQVADRKIHCIRRSGHGDETLEDVISNSCNSAMMDIVSKMGSETFYKYQIDFGFGQKTGIDLPNETSCENLMYPVEKLGPVELATSSFGQSFNCTPIQAINSFSVIANGGKLMKPYVVSKIIDDKGNIVFENKPEIVRSVVSKESCDIVKKYLQTVVDSGTGKKAKISGYSIGGKSGTGEQGDRSKELYTISFVGFFPVENPQYSVIVIIDKPKNYADGVTTAAPAFRTVVSEIIEYTGMTPDLTEDFNEYNGFKMPDFTNKDTGYSVSILNQNNINYTIVGGGKTIKNQYPKNGSILYENSEVILYTE